jgi:hypothetical protein
VLPYVISSTSPSCTFSGYPARYASHLFNLKPKLTFSLLLPSLVQTANARRYATGPTGAAPKSANWSLYLAGAGAAGLGAYLYIEGRPGALRAQDAVVEAAKPKATNTESPLSAKEFVDFKLKKVDAYNYNTDR